MSTRIYLKKLELFLHLLSKINYQQIYNEKFVVDIDDFLLALFLALYVMNINA